jgi:hypothetical protein
VNKVVKMDFKGQTAVLSAFVLVGMVFLVSAITEKAQASIKAVVTGTCGPEGQTYPCVFTLVRKHLLYGSWQQEPSSGGENVGWKSIGGPDGNEEGSVTYRVSGGGEAQLSFGNPMIGSNKCNVVIVSGEGQLSGTCNAGKGYDAQFTYTLRGLNPCQLTTTAGRCYG